MRELRKILEAFEACRKNGHAAALATVVNVSGSAYRRPGARMLIPEQGPCVGSISDGCLEQDVRRLASIVLRTGQSRLVRYDATSERDILWGLGLGCDGVVEVLVESAVRGPGAEYLGFLADLLRYREPVQVATVLRSKGPELPGARLFLRGGQWIASGMRSAGLQESLRRDLRSLEAPAVRTYACAERTVDVFLEPLRPPVSLVLCGAGDDAVPLASLATGLGWDVTVADARSSLCTRERFPTAHRVLVNVPLEARDLAGATAAVVLTHQLQQDLAALRVLRTMDLKYLGILGPRERTEKLAVHLNLSPEALERLHGPAGLDIGAETPEAVAMSILAEIQAVLASRPAGFLKERTGSVGASNEALVES